MLDVSGWRSLLDYLGPTGVGSPRLESIRLACEKCPPGGLTTTIPSLAFACRGQCRLRWPTA